MDIFFKSNQEVIRFCEYLFQRNKKISVKWEVNKKWGNQIHIQADNLKEEDLQSIVDSFIYVFFTYRLGSLTKKVIQENYYYSNKDEVEQIHDLSEWIVTSGGKDFIFPRRNENPLTLLRSIFSHPVRNRRDIHFDSIVHFGMKLFKEELVDYVGLAIDELKREEEHQSFLHGLREYIQRKEPNYETVHVLEDNPFSYFNYLGKPITSKEFDFWLKKEPLYLFGLSKNEQNLAPLVAIVPKEIHLYSYDPSNPKIQTIINVFQEKVILHSIYDFPFIDLMYKHR